MEIKKTKTLPRSNEFVKKRITIVKNEITFWINLNFSRSTVAPQPSIIFSKTDEINKKTTKTKAPFKYFFSI